MKITIKEVAKAANVSTSTVSRVISDSPQISEKTKEKVREVIKQLNYKPNAIARSLANKKTRIIGVVLPNEAQDLSFNPFFLKAMQGMSSYAKRKKYYITYAFNDDEREELNSIKDFITSNLIAGVCLLRLRTDDKSIEYLNNTNFPFVVVGRPEEPESMLWVDNDNFKATYNLMDTLIKKGHKEIAFLGAKEELTVTKDRLKGYKVSCEINGLSCATKNIIIKDEFTEEEGFEGALELIEKCNPTAILVQDDLLAFGVLKALKSKGISDISVVAFNNTPLAQFQNPPLASVDINAYELGYYAAKVLIEYLENNNVENNHYIIESELVERESLR
ncbi:LacI family DNA-binding transcriptional regulator [uncultured Clostridium sp.]|uniref:LacI family DNA-binding transcriptional regulator n=1 Tax=uncultured Clostridium sp. TaxID=59620 RepID=UPI0025FE5559|nr:LacI family DNA-binding transcriptional regulator [uncultured Clostridium sp.]